jgi:nuclear cap-binding protein subunit 1
MYDDASEILNLLNAKESHEVVLAKIRQLSGCTSPNDVVPYDYRQVTAHAVLQVGSRSFSHFLNAIERYIKLVQEIAPTQKGRRELLGFVRDFWKNSSQMRIMVIDKYLQYDLVDYEDVVAVTFGIFSAPEDNERADWPTVWTDYHAWELLNNALVKSKGRLVAITKKITQIEKEDEAVRAKRNAMVDSAAAAANASDNGDVAVKEEELGELIGIFAKWEQTLTRYILL